MDRWIGGSGGSFGGLTPHSTILQLYRGGKFYWWREPVYLEYATDLYRVTLPHNIELSIPCHNLGKLKNFQINTFINIIQFL
jgi:hypothetical protein